MARKNAEQRRRTLVEWLIALCLLFLLGAILFTEASRSAAVVWSEKAALTRYTATASYDGYIFREEKVLTDGDNKGPVEFLVRDGAFVTAQTVIGKAYNTQLTVELAGKDRARAAVLYQEIEELKAVLDNTDTAWQSGFLENWSDLTEAVTGGAWSQTGANANDFATVLAKREAAAKQSDEAWRAEIEDKIIAKERELAKIMSLASQIPYEIKEDADGYFYRAVDGFEALCGKSAAEALTPEALLRLFSKENIESKAENASYVGKLITSVDFYLAVPLSADEATAYHEGQTYLVDYTKSGAATEMTLTRVSVSGAEALLIFYAAEKPEALDVSRRQSVVIHRESCEGISLPLTALQSEGERHFVYVEVEGKAQLREVKPLLVSDGVLLIAPCEDEGYLQPGEAVVVTARSLYEGKVIG